MEFYLCFQLYKQVSFALKKKKKIPSKRYESEITDYNFNLGFNHILQVTKPLLIELSKCFIDFTYYSNFPASCMHWTNTLLYIYWSTTSIYILKILAHVNMSDKQEVTPNHCLAREIENIPNYQRKQNIFTSFQEKACYKIDQFHETSTSNWEVT